MNVKSKLASMLFIAIGQLWALVHAFRQLGAGRERDDKACG
jgi:hypothetical protein